MTPHPLPPGSDDTDYKYETMFDRAIERAQKPYSILFTVRRLYFDGIVAGIKTTEFRRSTQRWRTVAENVNHENRMGRPVVAVFMCGRSLHYRYVMGCTLHPTAEAALGHLPSEDALAMLGDGPVIAFHLSTEVK